MIPQEERIEITNTKGAKAVFTPFGARLVSLFVPNKKNSFTDVALGYEDISEYPNSSDYMGAIIGRFANRISRGRFYFAEKKYQLDINNKPHHLHGGEQGFSNRFWLVKEFKKNQVVFSYTSPHMEGGYPAKVSCTICYTLHANHTLEVEISAVPDADTILNLTIHPYFNFNTDKTIDILNHQLEINADVFLPVDSGLIPIGQKTIERNSTFDFREAKAIGRDIFKTDPQLVLANGYDHCFVLNSKVNSPSAIVVSPESGIKMELFTNQKGLQFYTGNDLQPTPIGKEKQIYGKFSGFCLEPQAFPNTPNRDDFSTIIVKKDTQYYHQSKYKFSIV